MADRILLIDDEPHMRLLLDHLLTHAGYLTLVARNGEEGMILARNQHPDLIIMDVRMPKLDGIEAVRQLRAEPATKHVPVIFLTALEDSEEKRLGFEAGADDYIVKPFDSDELMARVASQLRHRHGAAAHAEEARAETLSQLMVTLAHYLNNALTVMSGRADITRDDSVEDVRKLKQAVREGTRKIQMVVQSLEDMANHGQVAATQYAGLKDAMLDIHERLAGKLAQIEEGIHREGLE